MTRLTRIRGTGTSVAGLSIVALTILLSAVAQRGLAAEDSSREDLLALFRDRNVFDPARRAIRREDERRESAPPPRAESFRLVGAMIHDDKAFCFFDGSDSEFRRVTSVGEAIGDFKVVDVTTAAVTLEHGDRQFRVAVGKGMLRLGEGEWNLSEEHEDSPAVPTTERAAAESPDQEESTVSAADTSEEDDVVRRMLERRRQEGSR